MRQTFHLANYYLQVAGVTCDQLKVDPNIVACSLFPLLVRMARPAYIISCSGWRSSTTVAFGAMECSILLGEHCKEAGLEFKVDLRSSMRRRSLLYDSNAAACPVPHWKCESVAMLFSPVGHSWSRIHGGEIHHSRQLRSSDTLILEKSMRPSRQ